MAEIELREISIEDTENIVKWRNNENVKKNFCIHKDLTKEEHLNWYETKIKEGKVKQFIIVDKTTDKDVGSVYLRDIDLNNKKAEFGIFIGEDSARNKGIGSEATREIVKFGFENMGLHKIFLRVFSNNIAGKKAYEKAGFKYEGTAKDDIRLPNGQYQDIIFMAMIRQEEK